MGSYYFSLLQLLVGINLLICCRSRASFTDFKPSSNRCDSSDPHCFLTPDRIEATMTLFSRPDLNSSVLTSCDNVTHTSDELVVALSNGWYSNGRRCMRNIIIYGNSEAVVAKVIGSASSLANQGCRQELCRYSLVSATVAVWKQLGVTNPIACNTMNVTWSDEILF